MRKFINLVALAAILFVPSLAMAQTGDCSSAVSVTAQTPFIEGFEAGSMPDCWTQDGTTNTWSVATGDYSTSTGAHAGTYNVKVNISSYSGTSAKLVTPLLDLSDITNAQLNFWHVERPWGSDIDELNIYYRTSPTGEWTLLQNYSSAFSSWTEETIILPNTNATYQIAFEMITHYGYGVGLDDIVIGAAPTCVRVEGLTTSDVDSNSITLSWTDTLNSGASYTINYWANNGADTLTTYSTTTTAVITDLSASTAYTFEVTADCGGDDHSMPVSASFRTACGAITLPYSVDFEDIAFNGAWYPCWDSTIHAGTDPSVNNVRNHTAGGSYAMYLQATTSENYNLVVSPRIPTSGNNIYVRFWAYLSNGWIKAGVMTNPRDTSTFIPLVDIQNANSWNEYEFNTATLDPDASYYVAWMGNASATYYSNAIGEIDDIYISEIPSCLRVTTLVLDSASTDELAIHWIDNVNTGASYTVSYWANGSTDTLTVSATDTTATLSSLNANTVYNVCVTVNCSGDNAEASPVFAFRTACGAMSVPFFEDFDSYANGLFPPCWQRLRVYGTDPSVNQQFHHSGSQSMYLLSYMDTNLFCTPSTVPLNGNEIQVRYFTYMSRGDQNTWLKAGVMTDPSDVSTFIMLDSVGYHSFNYEFEEHEFNTSTLDANASYYVAWMFYGNYNLYSYYYSTGAIDDISISQLSSCVRPATAQIGTVGARQAEVSWASVDGASNYTVYYYTANDPANANVLSESVSDTTVTLTGLQPETQYYAWVATNCGGTESDLRPAGNFTTLVSCPVVTGLTVDTTTADGATISWHAGDVETEWVVVLDSNDAEVVNDSVYTISGLDAMTGHTLYVRALCDVEDTSAVSSINFATRCADATCLITANVTDSYDDGWNGGHIDIIQAGIAVGTIECPSGQSGSTFTYEVCSTAPVTLVLGNRGSWPSEMGGTISDGSGATVFTIENMDTRSNGDILATMTTPCPECIMPMNLAVDTVSATEATITWDRGEGSAWIVRMDSTDQFVTDTFYTFYNLNPSTHYTVQVATDCGGDSSAFASISFNTSCAGASCDITVDMVDSYNDGWNGGAGVEFYQNGVLAGTANLSTGGSGVATVSVCSGIPVVFSWHSGNYDYEDSYVIYDGAGTEVYNSATSGVDHSDTILNACPTCLTPTGVTAMAIDSTNITFVWTEDPNVLEYRISFNGDAYMTGSNGTETYTNLTPNTTYTFSVMAVCTPGDTSAARTITVKTTCGQMTLPFVESFEADAVGSVPSCWNVISGTPTVENIAANTGTNHLGMETGDMIATSLVPLFGDSIHVSFWANLYSGTLEAGVMTNPAADTTFIPLMTVSGTNNYELYEFNTLTLDHFTNYYVAFRHVAGYYPARIDDINIRLDDGCMHPANLTATPTAANVELAWSYSGTLPVFAIEYRASGDTAWTSSTSISDSLATLTGLATSTTFEVRVGAICGNDTLWSTVTFQTPCGLMPLPYFEDFDAYDNDVMPPCWNWNTSFATHWDGGVFFRSYHGGGSDYVVLPQVDGNISKLKIEFDTKVGTIAEQDGILIGVADANGTLLAWLDTIQDVNFSRNNHVHKTIYFPSYQMPAAAARVAFAQYRNWNEWALIDNINIEELPDCMPVDNLVGNNLDDIENTIFTWHPQGYATEWQVYVDTVTVGIDSLATLPDSLFTTVYDTTYTLPLGTVQGGGIYNFFVRSQCSASEHSGWVKNEFGAGTVIMNNNTMADTVEGCGFVVYDNGGPIAGYLPNSNSTLVLRTENVGSQLEVFGGKFGFGMDPATLTIYDGEGTTGDVLYTYNTVNGRDTLLGTVLAVSTTGSLTITFTANGNMCHTGYELYIHCTDGAVCPRPTQLQAVMTSATTATATWDGTANNYNFYYRLAGSNAWTRQTVNTDSINLTNLVADTVYDMYVVALCTATDSSTASATRPLYTHFETPIVYFNVTVGTADATMGSATADHTGEVEEGTVVTATATANNGYRFVAWMSNGSQVSTDNPYTFTVTADIALDAAFEQIEGIDDVEGNHIAIFPNPASTMVTIAGIEGQATVTVVDMNGREVAQHLCNSATLQLDITDLAQGAYFVRIVGERQNVIRKLVIR